MDLEREMPSPAPAPARAYWDSIADELMDGAELPARVRDELGMIFGSSAPDAARSAGAPGSRPA